MSTRRHFTTEDRTVIAMEVGLPGMSLKNVANKYGVTTFKLATWRVDLQRSRQARERRDYFAAQRLAVHLQDDEPLLWAGRTTGALPPMNKPISWITAALCFVILLFLATTVPLLVGLISAAALAWFSRPRGMAKVIGPGLDAGVTDRRIILAETLWVRDVRPYERVYVRSYFFSDLHSVAFVQCDDGTRDIAIYSCEQPPVMIASLKGISQAAEIYDALPEWLKSGAHSAASASELFSD